MRLTKTTVSSLAALILAVGTSAVLPVKAEAGTFGKIVNSVVYPVKKTGKNASVDTHKAIGHNSVQTAPNCGGTQQEVVKPDGHKTPAGQ